MITNRYLVNNLFLTIIIYEHFNNQPNKQKTSFTKDFVGKDNKQCFGTWILE